MKVTTTVAAFVTLGVCLMAYPAISAGTSYITTRGLVDRVVSDAAAKAHVAANARATVSVASVVRSEILNGARTHGLLLDEPELHVSATRSHLTVRVQWLQPVLLSAWTVPMSFEQTFRLE